MPCTSGVDHSRTNWPKWDWWILDENPFSDLPATAKPLGHDTRFAGFYVKVRSGARGPFRVDRPVGLIGFWLCPVVKVSGDLHRQRAGGAPGSVGFNDVAATR